MDKELVRLRFSRACQTYESEALVQKEVAQKLFELICLHVELGSDILEIGCGSGFLSKMVKNSLAPNRYILNDISENMRVHVEALLDKQCEFVLGDAQSLEFDCKFDGVVSSSVFQWFDRVDEFFKRVSIELNDRGYLIFSTFTPTNLFELRELVKVGLDTPSVEELKCMLESDFEILSLQTFKKILWFDSPLEVLRHIKRSGTNAIKPFSWSKKTLGEFVKNYEDKFSKDAKVSLTYEPILVVARKR